MYRQTNMTPNKKEECSKGVSVIRIIVAFLIITAFVGGPLLFALI